MASSHASVGGKPITISFTEDTQNRRFTLIVDARLSAYDTKIDEKFLPTPDEIKTLTAKTIGNWALAMRAYLFGFKIEDGKNISAIDSLPKRDDKTSVLISDGEPYITVWNRDNHGMRISMNSHELPNDCAQLAQSYNDGVELFQKYAAHYGIGSPQAPKQAPSGTQQKANQDEQWIDKEIKKTRDNMRTAMGVNDTLSDLWLRNTAAGMADGLISLETVNDGKSSFTTQAKFMDDGYDYNYQVKQTTQLAYPLSGEIKILNTKGNKRALVIGVHAGGSIWIIESDDKPYQAGIIKSDWHKALNCFGLWKEQQNEPVESVQVGYVANFSVNALCVMKFALDKNDSSKIWQNFTGLFSASGYLEDTIKETQ